MQGPMNAKSSDGGTALRAAAGNPLVVEKLLAGGADPTVKDEYGNTAESESCERGEKATLMYVPSYVKL